MNHTSSQNRPRKRLKITPLRPLSLRSAPFAKRALAWSADADLAVAADDSVYIFVPQLYGVKDAEGRGGEKKKTTLDNALDDDHNDNADMPRGVSNEMATRAQFATASLHMPIAYPPLDVRINAHLYKAAGLPFPFHSVRGKNTAPTSSTVPPAVRPPPAARRRGGPTNVFRQPSGAGTGPLTSVAATMNSVVSVAWSPVGVGRNRRPVLGVLTASGTVGVYGEVLGHGGGGGGGSGGSGEEGGDGADGVASNGVRDSGGGDMSRWVVLWAVGERLMVPPQRQFGECVVSFAWSQAFDEGGDDGDSINNNNNNSSSSSGGGGRALLVYATDQGEVVVVSVGNTRRGEGESRSGDAPAWHVYEVARFDALGPHPQASGSTLLDPDFVPGGTSFSLACSPWVVETRQQADTGGTITVRTCLIGYLARNYVGFRRVTVRGPWHAGSSRPDGAPRLLPDVQVESQDVDGLCVFLGGDAFLVWEDGVWTHAGGQRVCRGVVATPMVAKAFEVVVVVAGGSADSGTEQPPTSPPAASVPHDVSACGTAYPEPNDIHTNPIQDLILYPPDPTKPGWQPAHAYVRLSATATNTSTDSGKDHWSGDWYRQVDSADHADAPAKWPQWTAALARQAHICAVPDGSGAGDEGEDVAYDDNDADRQDVKMEKDEDGDGATNGGPDLPAAGGGLRLAATRKTDTALRYLHRYRVWGMAQAPGGGSGARRAVTAVLVTEHSAQHAEAGSWNRDRSQVVFGWPASDGPTTGPFATEGEESAEETPADDPPAEEGEDVIMIDPALEAMSATTFQPTPVSTEARMWSWMYGGGPPIQTARRHTGGEETTDGGSSSASFRHLVAKQVCTICGAAMEGAGEGSSPSLSSSICCARGHVFDRCGATGLAIQRPGISRVCGVCGSRTIRTDALGGMLREGSGEANANSTNNSTKDATRVLQQAVVGDICGRCGGKFRD